MARSVLQSFVSGARQMLGLQLLVSAGAVGLAGWTLVVTNDLIRERDRLQDRVIQLETDMGDRGIVVPAHQAANQPAPNAGPAETYPPQAPDGAGDGARDGTPENAADATESTSGDAASDDAKPPGRTPPGRTPGDGRQTPNASVPTDVASAPERTAPPASAAAPAINPAQIIANLFTPPPPIQTVVLHVRAQGDGAYAQRVARELAAGANMRVSVDVMAPGDTRGSGYAYFDVRQARASAAIVAQLNDIARRQEIAPWSAQLRGGPLPASGEYTAQRIDIVLPALGRRGTIR